MGTLSNSTPTARKEHKCEFCGGIIAIGEKYEKQTFIHDGYIYDWICHCKCSELASELNMYDDCDDGLDSDGFIESLRDYVYENHYDDELDDIAKDWQLPYPELAKKVFEELKTEGGNP